jgi:hypothetical protein
MADSGATRKLRRRGPALRARDRAVLIPRRVRAPADLYDPPVLAMERRCLDLDALYFVRHRHEQVVYCRFYRDRSAASAQQEPRRRDRGPSISELANVRLQARWASLTGSLRIKAARVKTEAVGMRLDTQARARRTGRQPKLGEQFGPGPRMRKLPSSYDKIGRIPGRCRCHS